MGEELGGVKISLKLPSDSVILRDLLKDQTKKDIDILLALHVSGACVFYGEGLPGSPIPICELGAMLCSLHTLLWVRLNSPWPAGSPSGGCMTGHGTGTVAGQVEAGGREHGAGDKP